MIELETRGDVRILHMRNGENRFNRTSIDALHAALDEVAAGRRAGGAGDRGRGQVLLERPRPRLDGCRAVRTTRHSSTTSTACLHGCSASTCYTVAAINGHAFAGGAMLATAHDHRVMREDRGYWCLPEVDLGLPLTPEMFGVLEAHLPRQALADAALTGRRYSGPEALDGRHRPPGRSRRRRARTGGRGGCRQRWPRPDGHRRAQAPAPRAGLIGPCLIDRCLIDRWWHHVGGERRPSPTTRHEDVTCVPLPVTCSGSSSRSSPSPTAGTSSPPSPRPGGSACSAPSPTRRSSSRSTWRGSRRRSVTGPTAST